MTRECRFEPEVAEAMAGGGVTEPTLAAHVAGCAECAALVDLVSSLRALDADAARQAHVPGAAQVWWRARVRARAEAQQRAMRPILAAQAVAAAVVVGALAAVVTWLWPELWERAPSIAWGSSLLTAAPTIVWLIAGLWIVLMPVVVYLAVARE